MQDKFVKITRKISGKEFKDLSSEFVGDMIAAVGLVNIHIRELLADAQLKKWNIDQFLDKAEKLETPTYEQPKPELIAKNVLSKIFKAVEIDRLIGPGKKKI